MKNKTKKIIKIIKCILLYFYYSLYCKIKKIKNDNIWLISERGNEARDNSYHFYKFLKKNHKEIKVKYIIDKKSVDAKKIKPEDIVDYNSKEHYILFKTAGFLISTHIMGYSPDMSLFSRMDKHNILKLKGKKIFLQHGIIKDYIPYLNSNNINVDLFISGAKPEYDFLLENFGHNEKILKYTGLARYDNLIDKSKKQILIMPSFRKWLNYTNNFKETEYYKHWNSILNNNEFVKYIEEKNIKVIFYPHYEIQKYLNEFKSKSKNIVIASFNNYDVQQLLLESNLLITDYSSVFFDFAYMKKPIIYYQFDKEKFESEHYQKGYYDYEKIGFGPVCYTEKELVEIIANNSAIDYLSRSDNFFQFRDTNNCKRIFEEIVNLKR